MNLILALIIGWREMEFESKNCYIKRCIIRKKHVSLDLFII